MPGVRLRLYEGEGTSIIGLSVPVGVESLDLFNTDTMQYVSESGVTMTSIDAPLHLAHIRANYYAIEPPLSDRQVRAFARVCLRSMGEKAHDAIFIDNRTAIPQRQMQTSGEVIAFN